MQRSAEGASEVLQRMETHTHKRQQLCAFPRDTQVPECEHQRKGTFHAKIDSIKDRNGMDLTEAEDIKKWWQEHTEKLYKKDLHNPDNHSGVTLT